jgi:hypothetical protein
METANICMTQESLHVEMTNEDNAHDFLQHQGIIHFEFIPQGKTLNQAYCSGILKQLHGAVHRKRPELWPSCWIVHHDITPAH